MSGVAGYFLFGTSQGKKLCDQLADEWDAAQEYLHQHGVLKTELGQQKLSEFFHYLKAQVLEELNFDLSSGDRPKSKRSYTRRKKPKQFKGV